MEYCINCDIYTPHVGAAGLLILINGKFIMGKLSYNYDEDINIYQPLSNSYGHIFIEVSVPKQKRK
jgi:hypothetical protein